MREADRPEERATVGGEHASVVCGEQVGVLRASLCVSNARDEDARRVVRINSAYNEWDALY